MFLLEASVHLSFLIQHPSSILQFRNTDIKKCVFQQQFSHKGEKGGEHNYCSGLLKAIGPLQKCGKYLYQWIFKTQNLESLHSFGNKGKRPVAVKILTCCVKSVCSLSCMHLMDGKNSYKIMSTYVYESASITVLVPFLISAWLLLVCKKLLHLRWSFSPTEELYEAKT